MQVSDIQLDAIFRAFPDLLFCVNSEGIIQFHHIGDPKLLYVPPEEFLQKKMQDVLPADAGRQFGEILGRVQKTQQVGSIQYQLPTPRGERWFEARLVPSTEAQVIVIVRDITESVQMKGQVSLQLRQLAALYRVDAAITSSFNLKVTLSVVLGEVVNHLAVDAADILLFNPNTKLLEFAAGKGFNMPETAKAPVRVGEGYAGMAVLERRAVSIANLPGGIQGQTDLHERSKEVFASYYAVPMISKGQVKGVLEVYHRAPLTPGEDWLEFLGTLANRVAVAIDNATMFDNLQKVNTELSMAYDAVIESWSQALEISGRESQAHIQNVVRLTMRLARYMDMREDELGHIRHGALLHDIGSMGVPEYILNSPRVLSEDEWDAIRKHPKLARQMLASASHLAPALSIPLYHHERWDGSGYPDGLKGEQIPLAARIFAVVDVFDALISPRPYRPAWTRQQALNYIREQADKLFDPSVVKAFLSMMNRAEATGPV